MRKTQTYAIIKHVGFYELGLNKKKSYPYCKEGIREESTRSESLKSTASARNRTLITRLRKEKNYTEAKGKLKIYLFI